MPELMIGARRTTAVSRPWRTGFIAFALLAVAGIVAWFVFQRSVAYEIPAGSVSGEVVERAAPGSGFQLGYGGSSLTWVGGLAVVRTTGDDHAIGAAHGRLLAPLLQPMLDAIRPSVEATVADLGTLGRLTHDIRLAWRWRFIDVGLGTSDVQRIAGLWRGAAAGGVALSFSDLLRAQAVVDLGVPSPQSGEVVGTARSLTVIAQQAQMPSRIWIGRTFSLPGLADGGSAATPVLTISHPEGRIATASIGPPGQLGVVTGINAHRIAIMIGSARTRDVRATTVAKPCAALAQSVLEQARTLDTAVRIVEQTPTLGSALFVIADGSTGKWVLIERTPSKAVVERSTPHRVLGDVLTTNPFAVDPDNDRARRSLAAVKRVERAAQLTRAPLADVAAMATILRDQRGLDGTPRPAGHRETIDDGRDSQIAILDPTSMELWVADRSAGGRMRGFDLRYELRGEGDRAAPPADIPSDPDADPDRGPALATARSDLRIARSAFARRDLTAANEACARARVRAPRLPESLELCASVAQASGDLTRAQQLYQRWLDGVPDDPQAEARAHNVLGR
jgi:hypothetical protein